MDITTYIESIKSKLKRNFDIEDNCYIDNYKYDLFAEFHIRNEKYLLVKKALIYGIENNEYVLMKYLKELKKEDYNNYTENIIKSTKLLVNPTKDHMCSIVTGVLVSDNICENDYVYIKKSVNRFKYDKTFAFGYKGWTDTRLLLISLEKGLIATNRKGKEVATIYNFNSNCKIL